MEFERTLSNLSFESILSGFCCAVVRDKSAVLKGESAASVLREEANPAVTPAETSRPGTPEAMEKEKQKPEAARQLRLEATSGIEAVVATKLAEWTPAWVESAAAQRLMVDVTRENNKEAQEVDERLERTLVSMALTSLYPERPERPAEAEATEAEATEAEAAEVEAAEAEEHDSRSPSHGPEDSEEPAYDMCAPHLDVAVVVEEVVVVGSRGRRRSTSESCNESWPSSEDERAVVVEEVVEEGREEGREQIDPAYDEVPAVWDAVAAKLDEWYPQWVEGAVRASKAGPQRASLADRSAALVWRAPEARDQEWAVAVAEKATAGGRAAADGDEEARVPSQAKKEVAAPREQQMLNMDAMMRAFVTAFANCVPKVTKVS